MTLESVEEAESLAAPALPAAKPSPWSEAMTAGMAREGAARKRLRAE
jgi:hypothetical protein